MRRNVLDKSAANISVVMATVEQSNKSCGNRVNTFNRIHEERKGAGEDSLEK